MKYFKTNSKKARNISFFKFFFDNTRRKEQWFFFDSILI